MFEKIVLASGNTGKLNEFSRLFADLNIEVLPNRSSIRPNVPSRTIPLLKMPWLKHVMPPNTAAYRHLPTIPAYAPTP